MKANEGKDNWRECRTAHELGSLDRPPITEWFRHLAGVGGPVPNPVPSE